jgi:hypothetical protein
MVIFQLTFEGRFVVLYHLDDLVFDSGRIFLSYFDGEAVLSLFRCGLTWFLAHKCKLFIVAFMTLNALGRTDRACGHFSGKSVIMDL